MANQTRGGSAMSPWPAPERDVWRPRAGIIHPSELRRSLGWHPEWRIDGQRLVRDLRFADFDRAFACVSRLAADAQDFGRHPDLCILDGNRVRVAIGNPHHVGFTVADLRLVEKVDAALARHLEASAPSRAARGTLADGHEYPLGA